MTDQVTTRREYYGPSWGPSGLTSTIYVDTPEGKSLKVMTDKQDRPHDNERPLSMSVVGHLEKL